MARIKIEQSFWLVGSAGLARSYVTHIAQRAMDDPSRIGYDEFKRRVFDCEFEDRGGTTPETAIIIHGATTNVIGVLAEYVYLSHRFGFHHKDWTLELQAVGDSGGRTWDMIVVKQVDGTVTTRYFDITEFYGKR